MLFTVRRLGYTITNSMFDRFAAPLNQRLAEEFYRARLKELRDLILAEETKFKCGSNLELVGCIKLTLHRAIVSELEEIRSGKHDTVAAAQTTDVPVNGEPQPKSPVSYCFLYIPPFCPTSFNNSHPSP